MEREIYRECELKFKIKSNEEEDKLLALMNRYGYIFNADVIETDFIMDTAERLCKQNHILFRIRNRINTNNIQNNVVLVTIKIKGNSDEFQDNYELEFTPNGINNKNIDYAIDVIKKMTGVQIVREDFAGSNLKNILCRLFQIGFFKCEIIQKKRRYYVGSLSQITLDRFPDNNGSYLEIEADNEDGLYDTVRLLGLKVEDMENSNYGKLLLETNKKNCVFDDEVFWDANTGKYINVDKFIEMFIKEHKHFKD